MFKNILVLALMVVLGSVADASVVWNWTGAGGDLDWYTHGLPASNWSVSGSTTWNYPSQQYYGVSPGPGTPDYRYINDDITAITIANGDKVVKATDDFAGYTASAALILGGNDCTLTLDNASGLRLGTSETSTNSGNFYAGMGANGTSTVNVLNGSTWSSNYTYIGENGTGLVNVSGGSTFKVRNGTRIGRNDTGSGGVGTMTGDGVGTFLDLAYSLHVGDSSGSTGTLTLSNGAVAEVGTRLRIGGGAGSTTVDSTGTVNVTDGSTLRVGVRPGTTEPQLRVGFGGTGTKGYLHVSGGSTVEAGDARICNNANGEGHWTVDASTVTTLDHLWVAQGADSVGTMTVTAGSTIHVGDDLIVGRYGDGTMTVVDSSVTTICETENNMVIGYEAGARGMMTLDNSTLTIGEVGVHLKDLVIGRTNNTVGRLDVLNGSTVSVADDCFMGLGSIVPGRGTLNISGPGSSFTVHNDDMIVGYGGIGVVNIGDGGALSVNGDALMLATDNAVAEATLDVSGGGSVYSQGRTYIGYGFENSDTGNGTATANITDSVMNVNLDLRVAHTATSYGNLNIHGDSVLNIGRDFETATARDAVHLGGGAEARIRMYDGVINVDGYMCLGAAVQGGSYSEFTMDAGVVNIGLNPPEYDPETFDPPVDGNKIGDLILGWQDYDAQAHLTINGGTMTVHGAISFGSEARWTALDDFGVRQPIPHTGFGNGMLRININGGVLQGEDLVYTGNTPDSLLTLTDGQLRILGSAVSEADMLALIAGGDIACPDGYVIYTSGSYTVLARSMPTDIPGDANNDGTVDASDAKILATNWGQSSGATWAMGDFNDDGKVDARDAAIMAANWGHGVGGESTAVPEPSTLALLLAGFAVVSLARRGQRCRGVSA